MPIYVYKCKEGHITEKYLAIRDRDNEYNCPICEATLIRQLTACKFKLDGCSGDFPTEYGLWDKRHDEKLRQAQKRSAEDGDLTIY